MERRWKERARAALCASGTPDEDVVEELAQHAAAVYEAARSEGADDDEALRRAEAELVLAPEAQHELRRRPARPPAVEPPPARARGLSGLVCELNNALRRLVRGPGHASLVIATLAVGIGSTTLLFSVVNGVLLAPLPWASGESLVRLTETRSGATRSWRWRVTNGTYLALAESARTLDGLAAWNTGTVTWSASGEPERVQTASVTASLFPLLRAQPLLGRVFTASEEREHVLVLSHGLWLRRFGARPGVIGQSVQLDGEVYRVIGVMARGFAFPDGEAAAWTPYHVGPVVQSDGTPALISIFSAVARLRSGSSVAQAADEATALARHAPDPGFVTMAIFGTRGAPSVSVTPAKEALTAEVRPALLVLLAAIGLLLAAATANVASLQLVRATARQRELAIRSALGAGQGRLARLLLAESLIVGVLGGAAGLALAAAGVRALPSLLPPDFPRVDAVTVDLHVTAFCVALALLCGLGAGLLPALSATRLHVAAAIAADARGAARGAWPTAVRVRTAILAAQIAIATVLLLGSLQLGRSFFNLLSADRGYEAGHLLTVTLPMPEPAYDAQRRQQIVEHVIDRLRGLPGVAEVAVTNIAPLSGWDSMVAWSVTAPDGSPLRQESASVRHVTPGYFRALGRRILSGRPLLESDVGSAPVVVVNRTFARRYQSAVGASVLARLDGERTGWTVVGIVEDLVEGNLTNPVQPEIIVDYRQAGTGLQHQEPTLLVRTSAEPQALAPAVRGLLREADSALAPEAMVPMSHLLRQSLARPRLYSVLLTLFAGCALLVAGVGLFGSLSYGVALRTREIGVRLALGARPRDIGLLITRQGLAVAGAGAALGLVASLAFGRLLRDLLYGVRSHDWVSLLLVPALLLVLAIVTSLVPALRAATVDPQQALRAE